MFKHLACSAISVAAAMVCAAVPDAASASNLSDGTVTIGVLTDMSSIFSDIGGKGSVVAAQMAVDDFGGKVLGAPVKVISADHQNKTDVAATVARDWFDNQHVDMVEDMLPSSVALAVSNVAKEKHRIAIASGAGTTKLSNEACSPYTIQYSYDTYALTTSLVKAMARAGDNSWYFLTVDYALGASLEKDSVAALNAAGGKVAGESKHPMNASDLSSYLLQAQASHAKVIGLANAGADTVNAIKTAREFGITAPGKQKIAGLQMFISDVHSLGLQSAQGMMLTTPFYWDRDDESRAWSQRFYAKTGRMPTFVQAGVYSSTLHYLKAVQASGTDASDAVLAQMRKTPVNDFFAKNGTIRSDGLMVHDMYIAEVKSPQQSKKPWDYYTIKQTIPAQEAFAPLSASHCALVAAK
ncbi:extracellular ligand-binding receptor [Caballeronia choica]|uniref:Extracellular ligand-binding receptor n=1 Tax=Caballeronia choica TaxID=326476 RepID=A0A158GE79_9BURK|nr:ABC transporter substrate-binding protein [Caballeronia choica]SAL30425.1 extracellular ligand-binding receptor [Caballeronia choica]